MKIKVGIVDDHQLFLKSLSLLLETSDGFEVILEAGNGVQLQEQLQKAANIPDMILIDVDMPKMNGIETARWLSEHYPQIKLAALSMNSKDEVIIDMIRAGCCSYLLKETHPLEFQKALKEIHVNGYYNADASNINFRRLIVAEEKRTSLYLSDKEKQFLQFACSDMTYKQIAAVMGLTERSVDSIREILFQKFNVQSRVGLCLEAVRKEIVRI